jgi:Carboxypeptidase regulatory-like domain
MRSVLRLPFYTAAVTAAALVLAGCGGGGGGGGTTDLSATALSLVGNVYNDDTGAPVSGATVLVPSLNNRSATTDASGTYRFDDISSTYTGGELQVTASGFDDESATVTVNGSALQVPAVALTSLGTPVSMPPAAGGTVSQGVAAVPTLPQASMTVPANALPAGANVDVSLTPVVEAPVDSLVSQLTVKSQAVGDTSARGPEIAVRIRPAGIALSSPAQITLPLPFALPGGSQVPIIQKKNGVWREVSSAVVDGSGFFAVGPIDEFQPTGVQAWHAFQRTTQNMPNVTMTEVTLASIQNNINNLANKTYVVDKVIKSGQTSRITARFDWGFDSPTLLTSPVDEESLVLGRVSHRDRVKSRLYSGLWNITGGPVTFAEREETVHVMRVLAGQVANEAGTFTATHGVPNWPRPSNHNQGGVQ